MVGVLPVLQHTPLAVIALAPEKVTFPPPVAPIYVIFVIAVVVNTGIVPPSNFTILFAEVPLYVVKIPPTYKSSLELTAIMNILLSKPVP